MVRPYFIRLGSLLALFISLFSGHTHILKIDLEGWEFDAISAFLILPSSEFIPKNLEFRLSQMLHLWNRVLRWWSTLERAGFRALACEPNLVHQNYNRMHGAELAEVLLVANYWNESDVFIPTQTPFSTPSLAPPPERMGPPLASAHKDDNHVG